MMKNKKQPSIHDRSNKFENDITQSEDSFQPDDQPTTGGESVKVALRLRPMNNQETGRGDTNCFKIMDKQNCQLLQKYLDTVIQDWTKFEEFSI